MKNTIEDKVSIILPNYNSHNFISKTIKSVLNQTYKNWELFIVDDGSDIKTKETILKFKKYKKIKCVFFKKNRGAGYCRNYAIKNTNSKFLAFIDSDDLWNKNKLKQQISFMKKNNYKFTYTNYITFKLSNNKKRFIYSPKILKFKDFINNTSIGTSTMIVERSVSKGLRFTNTPICEDYFYKCQILKRVKEANCLNKFLTRYRIRDDSMQSNRFKNFYWIWKINRKFNNLNIFENFKSLFFISYNSIKKYGLR